jgi:hypothetical protein
MIWRSILFLAGLALIAYQQSPVSPAVNGLESVVSGVATNALNGQGMLTGVKLEILRIAEQVTSVFHFEAHRCGA